MSYGLYSDQNRRSVGPDLGPNVCKGYWQTKIISSKRRVTVSTVSTLAEPIASREMFMNFITLVGSLSRCSDDENGNNIAESSDLYGHYITIERNKVADN